MSVRFSRAISCNSGAMRGLVTPNVGRALAGSRIDAQQALRSPARPSRGHGARGGAMLASLSHSLAMILDDDGT